MKQDEKIVLSVHIVADPNDMTFVSLVASGPDAPPPLLLLGVFSAMIDAAEHPAAHAQFKAFVDTLSKVAIQTVTGVPMDEIEIEHAGMPGNLSVN